MLNPIMLLNLFLNPPCEYHTDCKEQEKNLREMSGIVKANVDDLKLKYDLFDQMGPTNRRISTLYTKFKRVVSLCFEGNRETELHKQIYDLNLVNCRHHSSEALQECKQRIARYDFDVLDLFNTIADCREEIDQAMNFRSTASSYRLSTVYVDITRQIIDDGDKVLVKVAKEISDLVAKFKLYTHKKDFDGEADMVQGRIRRYKDTNEKGRLVERLTRLKNLKKMTSQDFEKFGSKFFRFFSFVQDVIDTNRKIRVMTSVAMPSSQEQYFVKPFQDLDVSSWPMRARIFLGKEFDDVKVPSEEGRVKRVRR